MCRLLGGSKTISCATRAGQGSRSGSLRLAISRPTSGLRARVTLPAKDASAIRTGEAVKLRATLQPPPEPIAPGGFDFARQAWFDSLGATGYATSKIAPMPDAPAPPLVP